MIKSEIKTAEAREDSHWRYMAAARGSFLQGGSGGTVNILATVVRKRSN
jgi:hypothetical protein